MSFLDIVDPSNDVPTITSLSADSFDLSGVASLIPASQEHFFVPAVRKLLRQPIEPGQRRDIRSASREAFTLCLLLRDRVDYNMRTFVTPNSTKTVVITTEWVHQADLLLRVDTADAATVALVIYWATEDTFWRSNIRSMQKLRTQFPRLVMDSRFLKWKDLNEFGNIPAEVFDLCRNIQSLIFDVTRVQPVIDHRWLSGAERLLTNYSHEDIQDMFVFAATDEFWRKHLYNLLVHPEAGMKLRFDARFIAYCDDLGRAWVQETGAFVNRRKDDKYSSFR